MKKMNKKGFTLIEMLVVIAIIAVLVSIVIPVVGSATEKAKEAADVANIRSAVAEITTTALANGGTPSKTVDMTQGTAGFVTEITSIGGISGNPTTADTDCYKIAQAIKGKTVTLTWTPATTGVEAHVAVSVGNTPT